MNVYELRSLADFRVHWSKMQDTFTQRAALTEALCSPYRESQTPFTVPAFSYPAARAVDFSVDWAFSDKSNPNWRERLICPVSGLNTRLRATLHLIDWSLGLYPDANVYVTEQVTPLFEHLRRRFPGVVGSEFFSPTSKRGAIDARGIRHEDLTNLSFEAGSFDAVLSFECFEHIPDFRAALKECRRVLKSGGKFFFTVPFTAGKHEHTIRARIRADGLVEHLLEPEYHGDPMQSDGCLCFTHFGWQLVNDLTDLGFRDVKVIAVWSREFGYIGDELLFFHATASTCPTAVRE